ncbi:MAG: carotenoid biosynthesis protein [Candidatus Scalindua sp.]|jgi:putative membrane protein|nr:carotenoid biosynthesis protein [Candidatus Scalindua sp.]MBT5306972.1 carotenoid biosynthesis protein [Candidatus Scalindua sp.]MBT6050271.1 carotenoid biosynthesis protein [Candidatus Scalindua sp.]MBT6228339.1 carotenoid biosynthesis protein [Candidatus Scalindua sp.]MBT6561059.1 carotenoid biosynthesis protein [Candidatus Scalindua sp.]
METFDILISTILLRPYVFILLGFYLIAGSFQLGLKRIIAFTVLAYIIAFASEYASTRIGIPYGIYHYTGETHGKELFISNVPFMDSLSYSFLGYFSYSLALLMVTPVTRKGWKFGLSHPPWYSKKVLFLSAILFVLQDVLIDPVSLRGSKWFLGQIYYYPEQGIYFGVPLSNFLGWLLVGLTIIYCFQKLDHKMGWSKESAGNALMGPVLYFLNMVFILSVTFYIGEYVIGIISLSIFSILIFITILKVRHAFLISTNG